MKTAECKNKVKTVILNLRFDVLLYVLSSKVLSMRFNRLPSVSLNEESIADERARTSETMLLPHMSAEESASENAAADERRRLLAIPSAMAPPVTGKPRMVKRTGPLGVNTLEMTMKASIAIWGMSIILFPDLACSMHAVMNERSAKTGPSVIMIAPIAITARTMMRISVEFLVSFMAEGISSGIPIFSEIYAVMTDAGSEIINRMGRKDIAPRPA